MAARPFFRTAPDRDRGDNPAAVEFSAQLEEFHGSAAASAGQSSQAAGTGSPGIAQISPSHPGVGHGFTITASVMRHLRTRS